MLAEALRKGDPSVRVEAELARAAGRTRKPLVLDALVEALGRSSWRDLVRAAALDGLSALRSERVLELAAPHLAPSRGLAARASAAHAVASVREPPALKERARELLEGYLEEVNPYFVPAVLDALVRLGEPAARGPMARLVEQARDGRIVRRAREALRELASRGGGDEAARLQEALDKLSQEHRALRDEVEKLKVRAEGEKDHQGKKGKGARGDKKPQAVHRKEPRKGAKKAGKKGRARS